MITIRLNEEKRQRSSQRSPEWEGINKRKDYNVYDNYNKLHLIIIFTLWSKRENENMNLMNAFERLKQRQRIDLSQTDRRQITWCVRVAFRFHFHNENINEYDLDVLKYDFMFFCVAVVLSFDLVWFLDTKSDAFTCVACRQSRAQMICSVW